MNYMPPEAFIPKTRYDQKLDAFAFGVLMMCTVLGREPSKKRFPRRPQRSAFGRFGKTHPGV